MDKPVSAEQRKNARHRKSMQKQQEAVQESMQRATQERGVCILLTGDGKGKSTSAFGMVMRSLGYGFRPGIVQFIKGEILSGEEVFLREKYPDIPFYQMATGFTWDTQDRAADIEAARKAWQVAQGMLQDTALNLVVLDELTYMLAYDYLAEDEVVQAIRERPEQQSVVITGRGGGSRLREVADTISEIRDIRHAYTSGIKARKGVDY